MSRLGVALGPFSSQIDLGYLVQLQAAMALWGTSESYLPVV